MEEQNLIQEQTEVQTQPAKADEVKGEDTNKVSLGKFKDVQALLSAYNSLSAEFTKRCQRIKELEGAVKSADKPVGPIENTEGNVAQDKERSITEHEKQQIVKDYLKTLLSAKPQAIIMDGTGYNVKAPIERPKTLEQAGILAKELLK